MLPCQNHLLTVSTGSGLVHLSPANGEEDIKIANKRKVKIFNPINDEVKFTNQAGKYEGLFVRDADRPIVEDLKECNALVKIWKNKTQISTLLEITSSNCMACKKRMVLQIG